MDAILKQILMDPNEASRNKRINKYLKDNNLTASGDIMMNAGQGIVQVSLSLLGLNGAVKIVKFVFQNRDTLFKIFGVVKCFFAGNDDSGVFFTDGVKNMFLNLNDTMQNIIGKGTTSLKILKDNVFG